MSGHVHPPLLLGMQMAECTHGRASAWMTHHKLTMLCAGRVQAPEGCPEGADSLAEVAGPEAMGGLPASCGGAAVLLAAEAGQEGAAAAARSRQGSWQAAQGGSAPLHDPLCSMLISAWHDMGCCQGSNTATAGMSCLV